MHDIAICYITTKIMNILYDYQVFTRQIYGGISRYFFELIKYGLEKDDLRISFFQGIHVNSLHMKSYSEYFDSYFGVKHKKIPKTGVVLSKINKQLFRLWMQIKNSRPDVYHPTYYGHMNLCGHNATKKVITVYDMIHEKMPNHLKGAASMMKMKRECIEKADKIIAISENTKKDLIEYFEVPESNIEVIYLAASEIYRNTCEEGNNVFLKQYKIEKPYIFYVGERGGYKKFLRLLKTFSIWSERGDFYLICVGGSKRWSQDEVKIIKESGIERSIMLFPDVTDDELVKFYSNAYVFVITSLYEGFGIPPLEAMSCGTPVIAAKTSSVPEVVGNAGLYFNPSSIEELLVCLDELISNNELREKLKIEGLRRSHLFSWEKTAHKTFHVYKNLLS